MWENFRSCNCKEGKLLKGVGEIFQNIIRGTVHTDVIVVYLFDCPTLPDVHPS